MIESKETLTGNIISKQTISGNTNAKEIKVFPTLEDITIIPTKEQQVFKNQNHYGYDNVTVNPIPDEYIIPDGTLPITENTTYDVRKYARVSASVHPTPNLQDKEVTPTKETQNIISDDGYDGLNQVTVNPIPDEYIEPSGTLDITSNGNYDVKEYAEVTTNIESASVMYIQENEPKIKDGIWVKTDRDDIKNINNTQIKNMLINVGLGTWNDSTNYEQLPYPFYFSASASVGTDIYLFFNTTSAGGNYAYKYDTLTNSYTKLTDVPINSNRGTAEAVGTNIYIFSSSTYKYDTLTDTYTKLIAPPCSMNNATTVVHNNSIYLFGPTGDTDGTYRYDPEANTYTKLQNLTVSSSASEAAIIGNSVYIFGLGSSYNACLRYDINANTFETLTNIPYTCARALTIPIGNKVIVMGSSYNDTVSKYCYEFDTVTKTFTKLTNIPVQLGQGEYEIVGDKIYILGSRFTNVTKLLQTVNILCPNWEESMILIQTNENQPYNAKLLGSPAIAISFTDCFICFEGESVLTNVNVPIYYGDGTKWIKFKN